MSVIWDLLRDASVPAEKGNDMLAVSTEPAERRRSARASIYVPVFVYGYTSAEEPFHQDTNTLQVNDNGGLLRLDASVHCGQKLLVVNRLTKEEQQCYVVTLARRPKHADFRVGVAFAECAPGFWGSGR